MASNFLEVWESQPPGILKFCTGISLPSHLRSAACRFTQFSTSINNVLFQRGSRPASCVVDVDWLKVWVQLKGKGINEDYRDVHLKWLFVNLILCYLISNEPLNLATLTALAAVRSALGRPTSSLDRRLLLKNVEERRRVFLLRYMYRITLRNVLLWNKEKYVFRHPQYCPYFTSNFHCLWKLCPCALKIIVGRTPKYNVLVPALCGTLQ